MENYKSVTEQENEIIEKIRGNNLIIETVAGSDKTTIVSIIAKHFKRLNVLFLASNYSLNEDTIKKVKLLNAENLQIHTFHSFALNYYARGKSLTDEELKSICSNHKIPLKKFNFNLIIVDEAEDLTSTYYEFICKLISDNETKARICIMGDKNQALNLDKEADARYLTLADQLFDFNESNWAKCSWSKSHRLNDKMVNFINEVFYQKNMITTNAINDNLPQFFITDTAEDADLSKEYGLYNKIKHELKTWNAEDILISVSTLDNSHLRNISNRLTNENKINLYYPATNNEKINKDKIRGKLVFATFTQAKYLERKVAIVLGFDNSYFENEDSRPSDMPPNDLYVAVTRSSKRLILVQHYNNDILPFLNIEKLQIHCNIYYNLDEYKRKIFKRKLNNLEGNNVDDHIKNQPDRKKNISVTRLISKLPQDILDTCMSLLEYDELESDLIFDPVELPTNIKEEKGYFRNVSAITGIAIPLYFQWGCQRNLDSSKVLVKIREMVETNKDVVEKSHPGLIKHHDFLTDLINDSTQFTEKRLLKLAYIWNCIGNKNDSELDQISEENFNWINRDQFNRLAGLVHEYISEDSLHEQRYSVSEKPELHGKILTGDIDCIDRSRKIVWEFKCIKSISKVNYLQLALYAYLFETQRKLELEKREKMGLYSSENVEVNDMIEFEEKENHYIGKVVGKYPLGFKVEISETNTKWIKYEFFIKKVIYDTEFRQTEKELTQKYIFLLFNITKNEVYKVNCKYENLEKIVDLLVKNKYFGSWSKTDINFIEDNTKIKSKYSKF